MCVEGVLKSGLVVAVHLQTPCICFTRARERGNGPGALRSDEFPRGLPELSLKDRNKVLRGNRLAIFSGNIMNL